MTLFKETFNERQSYTGYNIDKILFDGRTNFQEVLIFENQFFGKILTLDNIVQLTTRDEFIYHESLVHPAMMAQKAPRNILIIGGGDGGTLREVLKYPVKKVTMVELDDEVITLSQKFLPEISQQAFQDKRCDLIIGDGIKYVQETSEVFDVIIIDSTDPVGAAKDLFGDKFYLDCAKKLSSDGILVTQNGVPFFQENELKDSVKSFQKHFLHYDFYLSAIPTYVGGLMAFGFASNAHICHKNLMSQIISRFSSISDNLQYYHPDLHLRLFEKPYYMTQWNQKTPY